MASAPGVIAQFADAVDVAIQKYWLKPTTEKTEYFRSMYNVTTGVEDYYLKDSGISGLSSASRMHEQGVVVAEVPVQTNSQTYTQERFGLLLSFSWFMWKFGIKKRNVQNIVNELKKACYTRREELLARKYDAAHLSSYTENDDKGNYTVTTTGGDGDFMATATHPNESGGTDWSNLISDGTTTNLKLDYAGLKALWRTAARVTNPKGKIFDCSPNRIIVKKSSTPAFKAREILYAIKNSRIPEEFSHDGSAVPSFELVENPYLLGTGDTTSTTNLSYETNWHAIDTSKLNDMYGAQYKESSPISLDAQNIVYKTDEIQYKATLCFDYGHNDARGTFHSEGDN